MNLITITVVFLLGIAVHAAPQRLGSVSSRSPDKCGSANQKPGIDPLDSCTAKPSTASSPAPFGILNIPYDDQEGQTRDKSYDWTSCVPISKQICDTMTNSATQGAAWYFETSPADYPEGGDLACQAGFYLPHDPAAVTIPSHGQCEHIFSAMVEAAGAATPVVFGASVNLKTNLIVSLVSRACWRAQERVKDPIVKHSC